MENGYMMITEACLPKEKINLMEESLKKAQAAQHIAAKMIPFAAMKNQSHQLKKL